MSSDRVDYTAHIPEAFKTLIKLSTGLHHGKLDHVLLELVKHRASQINGCAYCLDMHGADLRKAGVDPRKIDTLPAFEESPFYSERERAALRWTEALTLVSQTHAPDADYAALQAHFDDTEISELTMAIAVINAWNRLGVGLRKPLPA